MNQKSKNYTVRNIIVNIYKNKFFTLFFLFTILIYGDKNISLTLFVTILWIILGQTIHDQELLVKYLD